MNLVYSNVRELRDIAKEHGITNVTRLKEDEILSKLQEEGHTVSRQAAEKQPEAPANPTPAPEPEQPPAPPEEAPVETPELREIIEEAATNTVEEAAPDTIEEQIIKADKHINDLKQRLQEAHAERRNLSAQLGARKQKPFHECVKEAQQASKGSEAIAKAQERAAIRRAVERKIARNNQK